MNPNFFGHKPLISLDRAKNKFGKIWRVKKSTVENKGIFLGPESPNPAKPRRPRILQGFQSARREGRLGRRDEPEAEFSWGSRISRAPGA